MRRIIFEVPQEVIGDFTEKLTELELENSIVGKTENGKIEIEVSYEKSESDQVDELEEYLGELIDNLDEEEDEDGNEEEEDEDED
jgi:hypothetical protein